METGLPRSLLRRHGEGKRPDELAALHKAMSDVLEESDAYIVQSAEES